MARTARSGSEVAANYSIQMQSGTGAYGHRVRGQSFDSMVSGAPNFRFASTTGSHSYMPAPTTSHLNVHMHDRFQTPHSLSASYYDEFSPSISHSLYSLSPTEHGLVGDAPTACRNPGFAQPSELYDSWPSYQHSLSLPPNAIYDVSSPTHHNPALDPTLYPSSPDRQSPWSTENVQMGPVHEVLSTHTIHDTPGAPLSDPSFSSHPNLDNTSEPYSEALDASSPCQWTKGDVVCNVMVQASRSHMNRHLHAYHGFGGSDARQTRCHWAGCGATMQQGSIARHMVTCHLQAKVTCPMCFKKLSRQDVISKHQRVCPAASSWR